MYLSSLNLIKANWQTGSPGIISPEVVMTPNNNIKEALEFIEYKELLVDLSYAIGKIFLAKRTN